MTAVAPPQADDPTEQKKPPQSAPQANTPDDDTALVSKTGEITEAILSSLQKTHSNLHTLILINNAGHIENAFGSVTGDVSTRSHTVEPKDAKHPDANLPVDQWFQGTHDLLDAAMMAAAAFLPGVPFGAILAASHRLASFMGRTPEASSNLFSTGRAARLSRLGAQIRPTPDTGYANISVERLSFRDTNRLPEARHYLWQQATDLRPMLTRWLTELSSSDDEEVAYTVGYAVGDCASVDLSGIFNELMQPWAFSEQEASRIAAGQALGAALSHPGGKELAHARIEQWSDPDSPRACQRAVASLCRSSWAIREPGRAMQALKRLEMTEKVYAGKWVQQAINTMWATASLFSDQHPDLAGVIVGNLCEWSTQERSSVFYTTPQLHLAFAALSELSVLREHRDRTPLLLKMVEADATTCRAAAGLLATGLTRKFSRQPIRSLLGELIRGYPVEAKREFEQLLSFIAASGTDDDRARLESYLESWCAELNVQLHLRPNGQHA